MVHHHEPECHAKKLGFYLQGQGHSVGLYNQNEIVSTISFIISKPVSFPTRLNLMVDRHKQRSENIGLLCSRSVSAKVNISINDSLDDMNR